MDQPVRQELEQLEAYYEGTPVFAMLSGLSSGTWGPIGRFCERREIPCLLPGTESPDSDQGAFYTLHFSRGLDLEADLISHHLIADSVKRVVQVFCDESGSRASDALATSLAPFGIVGERLGFDCASSMPVADLASRMNESQDTAAVLWLRRAQLADIALPSLPAGRLYVSSTMLELEPAAALMSATGPVYMVHPFRLPGPDPAMLRFSVWAKTRGIELVEPRLQAEAFFACMAANDAILHMGRFFVRDYLLDMLDHTQALVAYLPFHPRPTLGPGQRFLNKGGYILPIVDGRVDTAAVTWISP